MQNLHALLHALSRLYISATIYSRLSTTTTTVPGTSGLSRLRTEALILDSKKISVSSSEWVMFNFSLTPSASSNTSAFIVGLTGSQRGATVSRSLRLSTILCVVIASASLADRQRCHCHRPQKHSLNQGSGAGGKAYTCGRT